MKRSPVFPTLLFIVMSILAPGTLAAQDRVAAGIATTAAYPMIDSFDASTAGLVEIYSNLGPINRVYDKQQGWSFGAKQWIGMPFRIPADATIKQIKIATLDSSGTGFTLRLTEDRRGLPLGQVKHEWTVTDLPPVGTCCKLKVVNYSPGIKVQRGEIYWIVTETHSRTGYGQWEYTWNHTMSNDIAIKADPFVWVRYHGGVSAFAVYGTMP
jgi:hypothetical protein